ncbi:ABC transporter ATP-binding protein [uncultured Dialister sp.]|uniref:ABC transporter ATP-binding protein n=1 Tax=uncultured Dialister sp. TaxID=278064 RepID=UPI00261221F4|nr:ABC transporter ATP-binding protein [uncultured Dialister sp.]
MITIQNLICDFPDGYGKTLRALSVPSFTLADGGMAVITGPSGSGKTTFLHCLSGLLTPTSGTISIGDVKVTSLSPSERCDFRAAKVGYVFQKPLLLPYLTVKENIRLSASLAGGSADDDTVSALLDRVGLSGLEGRKADRLSGGQQQRVSFLRAIVRRPSLLLADEPTASLDEKNGRKLMDFMLDYQKETGCFLLCATHDRWVMDRFPRRYDVQKGAFL